jgi:hypothetical protein
MALAFWAGDVTDPDPLPAGRRGQAHMMAQIQRRRVEAPRPSAAGHRAADRAQLGIRVSDLSRCAPGPKRVDLQAFSRMDRAVGRSLARARHGGGTVNLSNPSSPVIVGASPGDRLGRLPEEAMLCLADRSFCSAERFSGRHPGCLSLR